MRIIQFSILSLKRISLANFSRLYPQNFSLSILDYEIEAFVEISLSIT
jgi:hypothetical protein